LLKPYGVAVDASRDIYIAGTDNNRIRMLKSPAFPFPPSPTPPPIPSYPTRPPILFIPTALPTRSLLGALVSSAAAGKLLYLMLQLNTPLIILRSTVTFNGFHSMILHYRYRECGTAAAIAAVLACAAAVFLALQEATLHFTSLHFNSFFLT
jgi:hypothetical protein